MRLFASPGFLVFIAAYAIFFAWWLKSQRAVGRISLRRRRWFQALHACAALVLILAAAGMQIPSLAKHIQLVFAADVSESIFERHAETKQLHELIGAVDPESSEAAIVVFGDDAGCERPMGTLSQTAPRAPLRERDSLRLRRNDAGALPDLDRITTVVDGRATDIGGALNTARGLFRNEPGDARAIVMLSDFRDTRGRAESGAAALSGSGIDLLAVPAALGAAANPYIAALRVPEVGTVGRDVPIEVTIGAVGPCKLRVEMKAKTLAKSALHTQSKLIELTKESGPPDAELRKTVRFVDRPDSEGVVIYTVRLLDPQSNVPADNKNNSLSAAVRIGGPSKWAVLARPNSTLAQLARDPRQVLGAICTVFEVKQLKTRGADYDSFSGILVDGLDATEFSGDAIKAVSDAVESGKGLVAIGGERAFGAGKHEEDGAWERILPVKMKPEDDRTRSVLFLIDVSQSMADPMSGGGAGGEERKLDFAQQQLSQAVRRLKPLDRLGLITFSGGAVEAAPLSAEPSRSAFLDALKKIKIDSNTDLFAPVDKAREVLSKDDAEEQLIVLLSDGEKTVPRPVEEIIDAARKLCPPAEPNAPRHTTFYTFGIGTDPAENAAGEALMKQLAAVGGGKYFPEFDQLAQRLEQAFETQKKDYYKRSEPFVVRMSSDHPVLSGVDRQWPVLNFRNRVKAKSDAETILASNNLEGDKSKAKRRPDPLLVVSGSRWSGAARCAALALSLDGADGEALLKSNSGQMLLPAIMEWVEAKHDRLPDGWTLSTEITLGGDVDVELRAYDPATKRPANGLKASVQLFQLEAPPETQSIDAALIPSAPGIYRAIVTPSSHGCIYRVTFAESNHKLERFVTVPVSAELTRLGTDRSAAQALTLKAEGDSRVIDHPQQLREWIDAKALSRAMHSLRPALIVAGLLMLLCEYAMRMSRG